jgi:hypothetical protein
MSAICRHSSRWDDTSQGIRVAVLAGGLRLAAVANGAEQPQPRADVVEDRVARAMETGRKRAGLTVEQMVRRLRPVLRLPEAEEDKRVGQTWYDWRHRPRSIPAVALVAAAEIARTSLDVLLSETSQPSSEGRVARLERRVAELEQQRGTLASRGGHELAATSRPSAAPAPGDAIDVDEIASELEILRGDFVKFQSEVIDFFARHGLDYRELMQPPAAQQQSRRGRRSSTEPDR